MNAVLAKLRSMMPKTLTGRQLLLLASGFLIIQLCTLSWLLELRSQEQVRITLNDRARIFASTYKLLSTVPVAERTALTPDFRYLSTRFTLLAQEPTLPPGLPAESAFLADRTVALEWMLATGRANPQTAAAWEVSGPFTLTPDDWEEHIEKKPVLASVQHFSIGWGLHSLSAIPPQVPGLGFSATVAMPFADGTWLMAEFRGMPLASGNIMGIVAGMAAQFLLLLLLAFVGLRYVVHPLKQLSTNASKFSNATQLLPLQENAPEEVLQLTNALNELNTRLNKHLQERFLILASLSHDLRTPLTRMRLEVENLLDQADYTKPALSALHHSLLDSITNLHTLTESTIAYARSGENSEPFCTLNMGSLLESLVNDFQDQGQNVHLLACAESFLCVRPQSLRRCLNNLVENGLHYGTMVHVEALAGPPFCIRLSDNGPGIAPEKREQVFDAFARLDSSRNSTSGGFGLGLTIARNLAHQNNAEIYLENAPHGGLVASIVFHTTA